MDKCRVFLLFLLLCISMLVPIHAEDKVENQGSVYKNVQTGDFVISMSESEDTYCSSSYVLKKLVEEDEEQDYYVIESTIYFNAQGDWLTLTHSTNDGLIVFEKAEYNANRLISKENKFITFFQS